VPQRQPIEARYVGWVVDEVTLERAVQLADAARRANPPLPLAVEVDAALTDRLPADAFVYVLPRSRSAASPTAPGSAPVVDGPAHRTLRTVECVRDGDDRHAVRSWLAGFHLGLTEGHAAGVVFDTYRALPAGIRGVVLAGESLPPERIAIVRRIADRCRGWHELLDGMRVHNTRTAPVRDAEVRIALLTNDRRQCLLIVNPSSDRFARGQLAVHTAMAAAAFDRAVSVATAERTMAGPVHRVVNNRVEIPLALAPGEAELFELF
jgi:hypothetical protein